MTFTLKNGQELYLDGYLTPQLDSLIHNIKKDWDFVILVTGDGMVRTGKSVLAINIAAYLADRLGTRFTPKQNIFFDSQTMIDQAQKDPANHVYVYDEAREALASAKRFSKLQQDLIDFFNECGQLNHIFILVLPDYFSLNWELATNRSEFLVNVYRVDEQSEATINNQRVPVVKFRRGFYDFFNRYRKAKLYYQAKRSGIKDYSCVKPTIQKLRFTNNYPIDEGEYRTMKKAALTRFGEKHQEEFVSKTKTDIIRNNIVCTWFNEGLKPEKIAKQLELEYKYGITSRQIRTILKKCMPLFECEGFKREYMPDKGDVPV